MTLELDPAAKTRSGLVFVMVRNPAGGPPIAVKRVVAPSFPFNVEITSADSMMGQSLPATFRIEACIRQFAPGVKTLAGKLPGLLPPGERILWQGSPDWRSLARTAFHTRLIAAYFGGLVAIALAFALTNGSYVGVGMTVTLGIVGVALLHLLAWGSARTTIYTLTNRRVVMRIGMAVPKCINLPLAMIASVDLSARADGTGDLPLTLICMPKLGYLALWPHARPLKIARPQPMLRSVPDAATVAALLARTCLAAHPDGLVATVQTPRAPMPAFAEVQAA